MSDLTVSFQVAVQISIVKLTEVCPTRLSQPVDADSDGVRMWRSAIFPAEQQSVILVLLTSDSPFCVKNSACGGAVIG